MAEKIISLYARMYFRTADFEYPHEINIFAPHN